MGDETSIFAGVNKFLNAVKNFKGEEGVMVWGLYTIGERKFPVPLEKYANFFSAGMKCGAGDNVLLRHKQVAWLSTAVTVGLRRIWTWLGSKADQAKRIKVFTTILSQQQT